MSRPRALFLDAHQTLFHESPPRARIYVEVAARHGIAVAPERIAAGMRHAFAALPQRVDGHWRYTRPWFARFIDLVFEQAGAAATPSLRDDLFSRFAAATTFALYPDVMPLLEAARPRVAVLGVISNWAPTLPALLEQLGIARFFDVVLASASEELEKPDRALFERALRRGGVAAEEALHVGDHPVNDLAGARAAGLDARLLLRGVALETGAPHDESAVAPADCISDLRELLTLLSPPPAAPLRGTR